MADSIILIRDCFDWAYASLYRYCTSLYTVSEEIFVTKYGEYICLKDE